MFVRVYVNKCIINSLYGLYSGFTRLARSSWLEQARAPPQDQRCLLWLAAWLVRLVQVAIFSRRVKGTPPPVFFPRSSRDGGCHVRVVGTFWTRLNARYRYQLRAPSRATRRENYRAGTNTIWSIWIKQIRRKMTIFNDILV